MKNFLNKLLNKYFSKEHEYNFVNHLQKEIDNIYNKHNAEAEKEEQTLIDKLKRTVETHTIKQSDKTI